MCEVMYIGVYNTYLGGKCFLSALHKDVLPHATTVNTTLCIVTQVHTCMPLLEAVHCAQADVTLPAKIQCALCLLLQ